MNFEQIEKVYDDTMYNAIEWANERECSPLYQNDIAIIGECLKMSMNKCFYNFESSSSVNNVRATSSHKTIFKQLEKIKNKLLKYEENITQ